MYAIDYGDDLPSPARVWLKEAALPGLAMSRSVGDTVGKAAGVISTPEITSHTLTDADRYLIIASDGLWEFIETDECIQLVQKWCVPLRRYIVFVDGMLLSLAALEECGLVSHLTFSVAVV